MSIWSVRAIFTATELNLRRTSRSLILRPAAESFISVIRRFCRVSSFLALNTHQVTVFW